MGDRIKAIGDFDRIQKAAGHDISLFDLSKFTILPGVIDAHTHQPENGSAQVDDSVNLVIEVATQSPAYRARLGAEMGDDYSDIPGLTRGQGSVAIIHGYVESGMTPLDAIRSATINAAELLGWKDKVGSLNTCKFADIIADRDSLHRDTELLVDLLSLYWLHIWWGADRMYLRMGSVFQGHKELERLLPRPNRDAERITLPLCLADQ